MTNGIPSGSRLDKGEIEKLIPHAGSMCLIDRVESWDQDSIRCASQSHRDKCNPLRTAAGLSAIHLLEYGAQAMAIHGGLLKQSAAPGFLAAVRNVKFYIDTLDGLTGELKIFATAEIKTDNGVIYRFTITDADGNLLITARATVINN
ncbi:MAG: hydroxymyristoyl-ACP dehydratase [Gammaproteobacteria bacterium]